MKQILVVLLLVGATFAQSKHATASKDCSLVASRASSDTQKMVQSLETEDVESLASAAMRCASEPGLKQDARAYAAATLFFAARELGVRRQAKVTDAAAMSVAKQCDTRVAQNTAEYDALVDRFNALVRDYNSMLTTYRSHLESDRQYDALVNAALNRPVQQGIYFPPPQQRREIQCTSVHLPGSASTTTNCY